MCLDKESGIDIGQGAVCPVCTACTLEQGVHLRLEGGNKGPGFQDLFQVICLHSHVHLWVCKKNVDVLKIQVKLSLHAVDLGHAKNSRHKGGIRFKRFLVIFPGFFHFPVTCFKVSQNA